MKANRPNNFMQACNECAKPILTSMVQRKARRRIQMYCTQTIVEVRIVYSIYMTNLHHNLQVDYIHILLLWSKCGCNECSVHSKHTPCIVWAERTVYILTIDHSQNWRICVGDWFGTVLHPTEHILRVQVHSNESPWRGIVIIKNVPIIKMMYM